MMKNFTLLIVMLMTSSLAFNQKKASTPIDVPYQIANGYFVKNTYTKDNYPKGKISSQKKFDAIFGIAAHMGTNGKPTAINFETHFVIAVVEKETNLNTQINIAGLKKMGRTIQCAFEVVRMEKMTATIRPVVLLIVEKKYKGKIDFLRTETTKQKIGTGGLPLDSQWIIEFFNNPERELVGKNCDITIDSKNGRFYGSDGCNRIGGNLKVSGDKITFSDIMGTKRACENMEQGDLFTKNLQEINRFEIVGGELFLYKDKLLVMTLESFR